MSKKTEDQLCEMVRKQLNEAQGKAQNENTGLYTTLYEGFSRSAYQGGAYLAKAIRRNDEKILATSCKLNEGIDFEPSENEKGGIIVFPTDVNAIELHDNKTINFLKQKLATITNRVDATKKIAAGNNLIGWTIGHFLDGRYTATNGKQYGESSLSVEFVGVDFNLLLKIAEELCRSFTQESVLLKDYSSNRLLFVNPK